MAIIVSPVDMTLRCTVQVGTNDQGHPVLRNRNYSRVRSNSTLQDRYDVCTALMTLQKHPVYAISYIETAAMEAM